VRASDSSLAERAIPPGVESPTIDTPDAPTVSDDAITANGTDDSAAYPASAKSDTEYAPSGGAVGSDEASGSNSENSAVLELPQVVNLPNGGTANASADEASANRDGNDDDDAAQSSQDGEDTAGDHDLAAMGSQVGTLNDYENQANEVPPGVILVAPVVGVVRFPRPPLFSPLPRSLFGAPMATSPIILPPTSSGPFPSTSPMLMGPRFGTFGSFPRVGSFPHGGLMGARR
jgi:hypothetical protein